MTLFLDLFCQWGGSAAIIFAYYNFVRNPPLGQAASVVGCILLTIYMASVRSWGVVSMEVILGTIAAYNLYLLKWART